MANNIYDRGDGVLVKIDVKKWVSRYIYKRCDPDSIKITIAKNSTKVVDNKDMQKDSGNTGLYFYVWQSKKDDAAGNYNVEINISAGAYSEVVKSIITLE